MSNIALDYDKTYTADPDLWDAFIILALSRGHKVNIVTMRRWHDEAIDDMPVNVIYTSRAAKVPFLESIGQPHDIFIDDSPYWLLNDSA